MSDTRKDLPPVSAANFLARVREVLQVYLGSQGSDLDRGLTVRDIVGTGLATLNPNGGRDTLLVPSVPTGGGSAEAYEPDLTIPPSPSSFTAVAGLTSILVETEPPIYSAGHGHGVARLFGVTRLAGDPLPTFASAVELSQFQGDVTSYATGLGKIWHLWLIWRSKDGVDSAPAGGTNGVQVTTGQDVSSLLSVLTGQIANSQLATALSTKIALIDAPASTAGSVASQVNTETDARVAAIAQEVGDRNTAITAGVNTAKAYTETWAYQKSATDSAIASMGDTVRTEFASADDTTLTDAKAYATNYSYAKSAIDNSFVSLSNTLTTNYQSADTATLNSAKSYADASVSSYAYSKAQTDSAISGAVSTVQAGISAASAVFSERWETSSAISQWTNYDGGGELNIVTVTDASTGAKVLRIGDNSGNDEAWIIHKKNIPFDPNRLYRITANIRRSSGTGTVYVGWAGVASDGTTLVNSGGADSYSSQHYHGTNGAAPAAVTWTTYIGYTRGLGSPNGSTSQGTLASPGFMHQSTRYVRPLILVNYYGQAGVVEVNSFVVEDVTDAADLSAQISTEHTAWVQGDQSNAESISNVSARLNSGGDVYQSIAQAQTTASSKNATFKQSATPTATHVDDTWIDTGNGNKLKSWNGSAWVDSDDTRIGTAASNITTLQSQISGSSGSGLLSQIQTEASTRVSETGYIGSLYSVRTQLTAGGKTVIGGFGLMGTSAPGAGTTIDFGVSADKFWVGAPTGSTGVGDIQPFVVQTTDQTVNGVLIPKGVYMDAAYIKNLTAMVSRLGAAWIDNAMVADMSAAKLTVGDGTIGGNLKSSNYSAGSLGWLLRPDGYAEFAAAAIRGQLVSSQINTTGLVVEHANIGALAVDTFQLKDNAVTVPVAAMYGGSPGAAFVLQSYDQDVVSASISVPTGSKISVTVSTVGGLNNQSGLASDFSIYHQVLRDSTVIYYGYTHGIANALNMNWASLDIPFSCTVVDTAENSSSHIYTYRAKYLGSKSGSAVAFLLSPTIVVKGVKK